MLFKMINKKNEEKSSKNDFLTKIFLQIFSEKQYNDQRSFELQEHNFQNSWKTCLQRMKKIQFCKNVTLKKSAKNRMFIGGK